MDAEACQDLGTVVSGVPGTQQTRTASHLLATVIAAASHVQRHLESAQVADTPEGIQHDVTHAARHIDEVLEHAIHLRQVLEDNPDIAEEDDELGQLAGASRSAEAQLSRRARMHADLRRSLS